MMMVMVPVYTDVLKLSLDRSVPLAATIPAFAEVCVRARTAARAEQCARLRLERQGSAASPLMVVLPETA